MKKQFIKLCLASILSLSLNAHLKAQESTQPHLSTHEATVAEDVCREIDSFVKMSKEIRPDIEITFNRENGELSIYGERNSASIDKILEDLGNQKWIGSLKKLSIENTSHEASVLADVLSKAPQLESVGLQCLKLENEYLDALAPALISMPKLQELNLKYSHVEGMESLASILSSLHDLQKLNLEGVRLGLMPELWMMQPGHTLPISAKISSIESLMASLASMTNLQELNLAHNRLGQVCSVFHVFAESLASMTKLQKLDLCENDLMQIDPNDWPILVKSLASMENLQELNLSNNNLGNNSATLAPAIAKLRNLQKLDLSINQLGQAREQCLQELANALSSLTNLHNLNLQSNIPGNRTNENLKAFAQILAATPNLRVLNLEDNELGEGIAILISAIEKMDNLQVLNLAVNNFANGTRALSCILKKTTKLRTLNLACNYMGEKFAILAPVISKMSNLQELYLEGNILTKLGESTASTLANMLLSVSNLRVLDLGADLTGNKFVKLAPVLARMTNLQVLALSDNELGTIGEDGWQTFVTTLSSLPNLQKLDLDCNHIDNSAATAFIKALSQTRSIAKVPNSRISDRTTERFLEITLRYNNMNTEEHTALRNAIADCNEGIHLTFE